MEIQPRDPHTMQDPEITEEYRVADLQITLHAVSAGGGATVLAWSEIPRNCYNGLTGSK